MDKNSVMTGFSEPGAYLAAIVESSDDAIISKDLNGIIMSWNHAAERIFGYTEEEAIGKHITLIVPPNRFEEETQIMEKLRHGGRFDHYETIRVAKDGHQVDLSMTVSPIRDAEGKVIGISNISRDITRRKELEDELKENILRLEQTKNEMEDMTSIASHDLKEPLRGLSMKTSMLMEDYADRLDEDGIKQLKDLLKLSQRSYKLIEDLLSFSRAGKETVAVDEIDLNEVVSDIAHLMEERLKEKNARIEVPQRLPHFKGDKNGMTEVIRNLVTNAVIYNDKPVPVVEIGFLKEKNGIYGLKKDVFYIKDNGIGIPAEYHAEIFRLFKRLPASKSYNDSGTGIGLAIVKKTLDQCNGYIWFESEPGKGSVFYFTVGDCVEVKTN